MKSWAVWKLATDNITLDISIETYPKQEKCGRSTCTSAFLFLSHLPLTLPPQAAEMEGGTGWWVWPSPRRNITGPGCILSVFPCKRVMAASLCLCYLVGGLNSNRKLLAATNPGCFNATLSVELGFWSLATSFPSVPFSVKSKTRRGSALLFMWSLKVSINILGSIWIA